MNKRKTINERTGEQRISERPMNRSTNERTCEKTKTKFAQRNNVSVGFPDKLDIKLVYEIHVRYGQRCKMALHSQVVDNKRRASLLKAF